MGKPTLSSPFIVRTTALLFFFVACKSFIAHGQLTQVYNIGLAQLISQGSACDPGSIHRYNGCSIGEYGFNWTDVLPSGATVTSVTVQFNIGIDCHTAGTSIANRLNSTSATAYSSVYRCDCTPTSSTLYSRTFTSGYIVGGANIYRISATTCAGLSPSATIGNNYARVTVTYNSGTQPTVSSFSPGSGCAGVTSVTITGTNFTGATAVKIGGTNVSSFTVNSATQITATVGSGTTGTISVTTPAGTGTSAGTFTVNTAPSFTACPAAPVTANTASGLCTAAVSYTVTATGTPAPTLTYAFTGATVGTGSGTGSGSSFNKGVTNVVVTASSGCSPSATCSFTVTVTDNEKPVVTCNGTVTIHTTAGLCTGTTALTVPTVTDNCPFGGNGLNFDGSNDQVATAAYNGAALTGDLTLECWFKGTSMHGRSLFGRGYQQEFDLTLWSNQLNYYHGNGTTWVNPTFSYVFTDNTWYHVAVVRNASAQTVSLYVNGAFQQTLSYGAPLPVAQTAAFRIGHRAAGSFFLGSIDEVRVWTVARTPAQIATNWNQELTAQPDLFALYHLNDGSANGNNPGVTTAADASGNANDGALTNFALSGTSSNWVTGALGGVTNNAPATYPKGNTIVTWTATDAAGNTKTCQQTVTVIDNQAPTLANPGNQSMNVIANTCAANYTIADPISDNCTGATWGYALTGATTATVSGIADGTGSGVLSFNEGMTTVVLSGTDGTNAATTVSFTVTVNDNQAPNVGSAGLTDPPSLALNNVTEALGYKVVYQLNIPVSSDFNNSSIPYIVNNSGASGVTYDRVAYFMELDNKWIWVSMDKFNSTLTQLGIPNAANNNVAWQQIVNNMNIVASANAGVPNATGVSGNIEMWHNCYETGASLGGIGGNGSTYDFNDTRTVANPSCFGSFQAHRYGTSQTLFAYNSWDNGGNDDLGIGNQSSGNPDWTFASNTGSYTTRRLYILVNASCLAPTATINTNDGSFCEITIPNYISSITPADNCTPSGSIVEAQTIPAGAYTTGVSDGAVITVNYTATDQSSNTSTCTIAITVNDDDAPTVTCPATTASIPVNAGSPCMITIPDYINSLSPTDNCTASGSILETQSIPAGNYAVSGNGATVVVNYTATDGASPANTTTCTVTITASAAEVDVKGNNTSIADGDNTPTPSDHTDFGQTTGSPVTRTFTIFNTGSQNLTLNAGSITLSGPNASLFSVSNVTLPASVSGPAGTLTFNVTYTPGMSSGIHTATVNIANSDCNEAAYDFAIRAELTCTSPSFTACPAAPVTANTASGQCSAAVTYTVTASGTPAPTLTYAFTGATTGSGNGTGSGETFNQGNTAVTVTATNACGTETCSFTVTVTDNESATVTFCPSNIATTSSADDSGDCDAEVTYSAPTFSDNCDGPGLSGTRTAGLASGSAFPVGMTTVTYEYNDAAPGNATAVCTFTVTVTDDESATVTTCPSNITTTSSSDDTGDCDAEVTYSAPTFSDNCDGPGLSGTRTAGLASGSAFPVGMTTVTYEYNDAAPGNATAVCTFTVTVTDNESPAILCPTDIVVANIANTCFSAPVTYTTPVGTDNCTPSTQQISGLASGVVYPLGITTNTFEVSDGVNPNSSCSFTVEVTDANGLPVNNTDQVEGFCTLAAAVADAGTTTAERITLVAGTYTGCATVDRDLRFEALGGTVVIDCLVMNGAGKILTLDSDLTINNLTLTSGRIRTNGFNLTLGAVTGGSPASYIVTD